MSEDTALPPEDEEPLHWLLAEGFYIDTPSISDGEGWIPLEFIAAIKCVMPSGETGMVYTTTPGLSPWEAVGMAAMLEGRLREPSMSDYEDNE